MASRCSLLSCACLLLLVFPLDIRSSPGDVQIEMKNVRLHVDDGIILDVSRLHGIMVSRNAGAPPILDDQSSYILELQTAQMSMEMSSLQN